MAGELISTAQQRYIDDLSLEGINAAVALSHINDEVATLKGLKGLKGLFSTRDKLNSCTICLFLNCFSRYCLQQWHIYCLELFDNCVDVPVDLVAHLMAFHV